MKVYLNVFRLQCSGRKGCRWSSGGVPFLGRAIFFLENVAFWGDFFFLKDKIFVLGHKFFF